ncbi:MAG: hypothetical protein GTN93_21390 [Anaerolineae bacterium]|nr:hypothetical protein [Anaerolineae bacterium]
MIHEHDWTKWTWDGWVFSCGKLWATKPSVAQDHTTNTLIASGGTA